MFGTISTNCCPAIADDREGSDNGERDWGMLRRTARELALQALYEADLTGRKPERALELRLAENRFPPAVRSFSFLLVRGTFEKLGEIDERISRYSKEWRLERLARVDLAILRLAIFELLYLPEVPPSVAINEAVELAKTFSTDEAARFINGVLGRVVEERPLEGGNNQSGKVPAVEGPAGSDGGPRPPVAPGSPG